MYGGDEIPAGGIITGVGTVQGISCMIVANDSTYMYFSPCSKYFLTFLQGQRRYLLPDYCQEASASTSYSSRE